MICLVSVGDIDEVDTVIKPTTDIPVRFCSAAKPHEMYSHSL